MKKFDERLMVSESRRFFRDETGMETLNVVMILALASMVALIIYFFGNRLFEWLRVILLGSFE